MPVKNTVVQHLSAETHRRYALFAPLPCLSYIKQVKKRSTASYSDAEKNQSRSKQNQAWKQTVKKIPGSKVNGSTGAQENKTRLKKN